LGSSDSDGKWSHDSDASSTDIETNLAGEALERPKRSGSLTKSLQEVSSQLVGLMMKAQEMQSEDPEDTYQDAKEDYEDLDDDASMANDGSLDQMDTLSFDSGFSANNKEELELERHNLEEDNMIMEERHQEDQDGFRIMLNPVYFQEQLMIEAGPFGEIVIPTRVSLRLSKKLSVIQFTIKSMNVACAV
jgi:hypothetical protein